MKQYSIIMWIALCAICMIVLVVGCETPQVAPSAPEELLRATEMAREQVTENGYDIFDGARFAQAEEDYAEGVDTYGSDNALSAEKLSAALDGYNALISAGEEYGALEERAEREYQRALDEERRTRDTFAELRTQLQDQGLGVAQEGERQKVSDDEMYMDDADMDDADMDMDDAESMDMDMDDAELECNQCSLDAQKEDEE